jgi:hypothetical protein
LTQGPVLQRSYVTAPRCKEPLTTFHMSRIVVVALLSLLPTGLLAQTCMGGASFADGRAQIRADASSSTAARSVIGGVSMGSPRGPFASLGFGRAHDDGLDDKATLFAATAGIGAGFRPIPKTQFCPFISAEAVNGVDFANGDRLSSHAFGFGTAVGTILSNAAGFGVAPFVAGAVVTQTATAHVVSPPRVGVSNNNYRFMTLGAGFVLKKVITIRPSMTFTFVDGETSRSSGLRVSYSFGAPRARSDAGPGSLATVWLNTRARVYYCPGSRLYGGSEDGTFTTEREALAGGAAPEFGKRCRVQ